MMAPAYFRYRSARDALATSFADNAARMTSALMTISVLQETDFDSDDVWKTHKDIMSIGTKFGAGPAILELGSISYTCSKIRKPTFEKLANLICTQVERMER